MKADTVGLHPELASYYLQEYFCVKARSLQGSWSELLNLQVRATSLMSIVLRMYLNIQPLRASSSHIMYFWMFLKMLHCIRVYLNDNSRLPVNHSKSIQKLSVSVHKDKTRGKGHHWWTRFNCQLDVLCSLYQAEQHLWGWNMSAKTCSPNLATCMSVFFFFYVFNTHRLTG